MKRTQKSRTLNKFKNDVLRKSIEIEEELNKRRLESYNKKVDKCHQRQINKNLSQKESLKKEQLKQAENLKAINNRRQKLEEQKEEDKMKCLDNLKKKCQKYCLNRQNKDKELKMKYNKFYILAKNVNDDYIRNKAKNSYE